MAFQDAVSPDALHKAFKRVRSNGGAPGSDGVRIDLYQKHLTRSLHNLSEEVLSGTYLPHKLRKVKIPKNGGGTRRLLIPTVRDRILQTAIVRDLQEDCDARMHRSSFAYRPKRSVPMALQALHIAMREQPWVVDVDIHKFFDTIPHTHLILDLVLWVSCEQMTALFLKWLKGFSKIGIGVAQGAPISPLLANMYLHPVDCLLSANRTPFIRYADDIVILATTKKEAEKYKRLLASLLESRGLKINSKKSRIWRPDQRFVYLGAAINGVIQLRSDVTARKSTKCDPCEPT